MMSAIALPAGGGDPERPREAARTAWGRAEVDLLLEVMENREQSLPDGSAFDFSGIREELKL